MFEFVVLFTIFVGLVGVLVGLHLYQRQRALKYGPLANWLRVERWLNDHQLQAPTVDETMCILNKKLKEVVSEDWKYLRVSSFLPGTHPPEFTVKKVVKDDSDSIEFHCDIEWPLCVPGLEVELLTDTKLDQRINCQLLVEWMLAQVQVAFSDGGSNSNGNGGGGGGGLLVSFRHTAPPLMGLSCSVEDSQQNVEEERERLASSVADAIHQVFADLHLQNEPISNTTCTPLPTVLVSAPPEEEEEVTSRDIITSEGTAISIEERSEDGSSGGGSRLSGAQDEGFSEDLSEQEPEEDVGEAGKIDKEVAGEERKKDKEVGEAVEKDTEIVEEVKKDKELVVEERKMNIEEELELTNQMTPSAIGPAPTESEGDNVPPMSPGWKRSSSYEQLQQFVLGPVGEEGAGDRGRALTLSMAGSETESIYGADDRIPSTLVFEVTDSVKVRHIVALSSPHASKLRRHFSNAQKLHIYNDHCFVATHLRQRSVCAACRSKISGLFGKQAYVCRDCGLVTHKQCHFKVEGLCTNSQLHKMNLIYPDRTSTQSS